MYFRPIKSTESYANAKLLIVRCVLSTKLVLNLIPSEKRSDTKPPRTF